MFLLIIIHKIIKAFKLIASIHEDQNILSLLPQAQGKSSMSQDSSHRRPWTYQLPLIDFKIQNPLKVKFDAELDTARKEMFSE